VGEKEGVETMLETIPQQKGPAPHRRDTGTACSSRTKALWSKVATWDTGSGARIRIHLRASKHAVIGTTVPTTVLRV
jgi:hypothetical protein